MTFPKSAVLLLMTEIAKSKKSSTTEPRKFGTKFLLLPTKFRKSRSYRKLIITMASKVVATATVRAVKRKLLPTRAALTLVSYFHYFKMFLVIPNIINASTFQTPAAVNRVKQLLDGKPEYVSILNICIYSAIPCK